MQVINNSRAWIPSSDQGEPSLDVKWTEMAEDEDESGYRWLNQYEKSWWVLSSLINKNALQDP